uniref:Cystatin domain-containing protein n=1 Tax=Trichuris muris TaxID=70415 RepID=A0A5S6R3R5_TRIMR
MAVSHVIDTINVEENGNTFILIQVVEARYQVVAGLMYYVTFSVGEADCSSVQNKTVGASGQHESNDASKRNCRLVIGGQRRTYKAKVWYAPWQSPPAKVMEKQVLNSYVDGKLTVSTLY